MNTFEKHDLAKMIDAALSRSQDAGSADAGGCPQCGADWEIVRPGKSQPTCDCQDKCPDCGAMRGYYSIGEIAPMLSGFLCPVCDAAPNPEGKGHRA